MTCEEIYERDEYLNSLPMGPERWQGSIQLCREKALCPTYKHPSRDVTFQEWIAELVKASKETGVDWGSETARYAYFEGQPSSWVEHYDEGDSPEEAIASDMQCWD